MKLALKIIGSVFAAFLLVIIVFVFMIARGIDGMCGNSELSTTQIPGTKYKVVVFQRDCGATTGFSTQASIIKSDEKLKNDGGNIFSADDNHGGGTELKVKIYSPHSIELSHCSSAQVFRAEQSYKGIKISYANMTTANMGVVTVAEKKLGSAHPLSR